MQVPLSYMTAAKLVANSRNFSNDKYKNVYAALKSLKLSDNSLFVPAILGIVTMARISLERSDKVGYNITIDLNIISREHGPIYVIMSYHQKRKTQICISYRNDIPINVIDDSEINIVNPSSFGEHLLLLEKLPSKVKNILIDILFKFKNTKIITSDMLRELIYKEQRVILDNKIWKINDKWIEVFSTSMKLFNTLQTEKRDYPIVYDVAICKFNCCTMNDNGMLSDDPIVNYFVRFN